MSFINEWGPTIWTGFLETLTMTSITLVISVILGIPLGVLLVNSSDQGLHPNKSLYTVVNWLVNIFRSLPFIILLFLILPLTKIIAGTTIGIRGVILPLVFYCVPYLARLVESSILEVDSGIIEAYQSMGISNGKIIVNVVLREARSGLVRGLTITTRNRNGRSGRCRRLGRHCLSVRIPTLPTVSHVCDDRCFDCFGSNRSDCGRHLCHKIAA